MFMRVSTYRPEAGSTGQPSEETVQRVLALPGCRGLYYVLSDGGTSLSLSLWEDKEALDGSKEAANALRAETAAQQHMDILSVEDYEVLTEELKP
ncbi:hypothetical protein [Sinomonas mesophila]|uniref:hypothetical protein n=1 Tax=Sinomonas mesophila TaxID=1531955 RepID=UPI00098512DB|nr:hypothetical protein [Sinomonas mesophila]